MDYIICSNIIIFIYPYITRFRSPSGRHCEITKRHCYIDLDMVVKVLLFICSGARHKN
jgi:hypothetical protein